MKNLSAIAFALPILLAVLLSASAYVLPSSESGVGSHCRLPNGGRGSCRLVTDCPPALAAVRHGTRRGTHGELARCGFQGSVEIVCCSDGGRGTGVRRQTVGGGRRTGTSRSPSSPDPSRKPETEWLGTPGRGGSPMQTLSERKSMSACRYYTTNCPKSVSPYITGGTTAQRGEFPHMAALGYPSNEQGNNISWDCGGTLISDRYIMTAAHCTSLSNRKPVVVRLGELDLSTDEDGATPVDFSIEKVHIHPSFKSGPLYHDLALLRLKQPVKFTEFICPACLYPGRTSSLVASGGDRNDLTDRILADGEEIGPRINDEVDLRERHLTVSGWGTTTHLGDKSPILQKANLKPYSIENCSRTLTQATGRSSNSFMPQGLMQSLMLCAGDPTGKQDTCQGDSGGPLQYQPEDSPIYTVIGITSFGDKCGFSVPSVYTRVSSYLEWIEGIVWPGAPPS